MSMVRQDSVGIKRNPFNEFACSTCDKRLGDHWLFRPDKMTDTTGGIDGRKPDGRLYCHRDQSSYCGSYHQRQLRRTLVAGYV